MGPGESATRGLTSHAHVRGMESCQGVRLHACEFADFRQGGFGGFDSRLDQALRLDGPGESPARGLTSHAHVRGMESCQGVRLHACEFANFRQGGFDSRLDQALRLDGSGEIPARGLTGHAHGGGLECCHSVRLHACELANFRQAASPASIPAWINRSTWEKSSHATPHTLGASTTSLWPRQNVSVRPCMIWKQRFTTANMLPGSEDTAGGGRATDSTRVLRLIVATRGLESPY